MPKERRSAKSPNKPIERKVLDDRLRTFALGSSARPQSVLIELDLPEPQVKITGKRKIGGRRLAAKRIEVSPADLRRRKRRISQMVKNLEDLGAPATVLESSGVVVSKLGAEALCQIAKSNLVRAIHPNRKHKLQPQAS